MSELEVRIVQLEPIRVASAYGFGPNPEEQAWDKLLTWAKSKGLLELSPDRPRSYRLFGFNNPSPSAGSPNYGYEQWMTVASDVQPEGDIAIKEFPGGLYAVTRFQGLSKIGKVWEQLAAWCDTSQYKFAHHQWLEELLSSPLEPDLEKYIFDLYLPIY